MRALSWMLGHYTIVAAWLIATVIAYSACGALTAAGVAFVTAFAFSFGHQHGTEVAAGKCPDCHH